MLARIAMNRHRVPLGQLHLSLPPTIPQPSNPHGPALPLVRVRVQHTGPLSCTPRPHRQHLIPRIDVSEGHGRRDALLGHHGRGGEAAVSALDLLASLTELSVDVCGLLSAHVPAFYCLASVEGRAHLRKFFGALVAEGLGNVGLALLEGALIEVLCGTLLLDLRGHRQDVLREGLAALVLAITRRHVGNIGCKHHGVNPVLQLRLRARLDAPVHRLYLRQRDVQHRRHLLGGIADELVVGMPGRGEEHRLLTGLVRSEGQKHPAHHREHQG
mmetsp:Transcript_15425/g.30471  ORF Transcript_15425/g.30471 Transcript_15425/m.30471 type:complete len:272 (-) Transcript_15425:18-833(-)